MNFLILSLNVIWFSLIIITVYASKTKIRWPEKRRNIKGLTTRPFGMQIAQTMLGCKLHSLETIKKELFDATEIML
jgi:hypothetical protein